AFLLASGSAPATIDYYVNVSGDAHNAGVHPGVCQTSSMNFICTLRAAVEAAATVARLPGEDVVIHLIAAYSPYTLSIAETLTVPNLTTVMGAGAATTIVDANHLARAFTVGGSSNVTLSELTIRNGTVAAFGGCVYTDGELMIEDSILEYCSGTAGGG